MLVWDSLTNLVLRLGPWSWVVIDHKSQANMPYLLHNTYCCGCTMAAQSEGPDYFALGSPLDYPSSSFFFFSLKSDHHRFV